jgi:hypothetical protein
MAALVPVNALADAAPGCVALQTGGDATAVAYDDDLILVNMSVWRSLEQLRAFVYTNHDHLAIPPAAWFATGSSAYLVLWWIPAGHIRRSTRQAPVGAAARTRADG